MPDIRITDVDCTLQILQRGRISVVELRAVLVNKIQGIGGRYSGLLEFMDAIGLVRLSENYAELKVVVSGESCRKLVTRKMLGCTAYAREFSENCKSVEIVELDQRSISISASHTSSSFLWFLLALEQLNVLQREHSSLLVVAPECVDEFFKFISFSLECLQDTTGLTPEKLKAHQEANAEAGLSAEIYVMYFERQRLDGHPLLDMIKHVALSDVTAGFDILSFEDVKELVPSRRIEVKSWSGIKRFYFSADELRTAKKIGDRYHIYLVDRSKMGDPDYSPEIYTNPNAAFFGEQGSKEWKVESDGWVMTHCSALARKTGPGLKLVSRRMIGASVKTH